MTEAQHPQRNLGDILSVLPAGTTEQLIEVLNTEPDSIAAAKQLKALLKPHAAALAAIEIVPDYLAYALLHVRSLQQTQSEPKPESPPSARDLFNRGGGDPSLN